MNNNDNYNTTPHKKQTIEALWRLEKIILDTLNFKEVVQKIVDSVLIELGYLKLGYHIVVLCIYDPKKKLLKRVSISETPFANKALLASPIPFSEIAIPLAAKDNLCIKAFLNKKPKSTSYWPDILSPPFSSTDAIAIQKLVGIKTSLIYPIVLNNQALGVIIFSMAKSKKEVTADERGLIAGFTDVVGLAVQNSRLYTSLEEATKNVKIVNDRLKEVDKLKDEFVSIASHELRTPMTAIRSYLWLAIQGKGGPITEKQKFYLDRSYSSTVRLIKLVNDMLNVSRIESGRLSYDFQKIDLPKLVNDVMAEVKPRVDELKIKLKVQSQKSEVEKKEDVIIKKLETLTGKSHDSKLLEVIGDSDKIKEVLINLIGNSLKFTPRDGEINISFIIKDNLIITSVRDTGQGIEPEYQSKLFQKFGMVKDSYVTNQNASQGTGLGLFICKQIVTQHGGDIWVESEGKGKGATFSFSLQAYELHTLEELKNKVKAGIEGLGIIHSEI